MSRYHRQWGTASDLLRGRLSRWWLAVAAALALAFAAAPAQAAPFVYVTNTGSDTISQYDVGAGGLLSPLVPAAVPAGDGPKGVAVSPDGRSVYVTNAGSNSVSQYDVGAGGALSPKSPATVATDFSPGAVAVSPNGKSVYVTANSFAPDHQGYVLQYDVRADGTLSPKSPAMVVDPFGPVRCTQEGTAIHCTGAYFSAVGVAVSPDGKSVYVAGILGVPYAQQGVGVVLQYDVGAGGQLSPKNPPAVVFDGAAVAVAVSPDGASVYVTSGNDDVVSQYDVGAGGLLSPKNPPEVFPGSDTQGGVAVSPDGVSVYVIGFCGGPPGCRDNVFQYDVGADGTLSPKSPATVPAGNFPAGVAVSPDSESVYVANAGSGSVSQYDVGAGGVLSPKSPATVVAGIEPGGVAVSPLVPTRREQCKNGGWRDFPQFRNQGNCVSFVQTHR